MSKAVSEPERDENRRKFLAKHGIIPEQSVLVYLQYEGNDYRRYFTVDSKNAGDGIARSPSLVSDALFTREKNLALLLPVADCIGAVLFDEVNHVLGLAHFGRHNLEQDGGLAVIAYIKRQFGTNPVDVRAWLSPAAGKDNYPLYDFNDRSMHDVAQEQLLAAGVLVVNIAHDERDTTTDLALFSHSEFLKDRRRIDGRQAVVAMMK